MCRARDPVLQCRSSACTVLRPPSGTGQYERRMSWGQTALAAMAGAVLRSVLERRQKIRTIKNISLFSYNTALTSVKYINKKLF